MNAGPTSVRVYQVLRELILSGELRPGTHLDPVTISGELAASTTPVREALCRLTGEELLETRQGSGFMLPLLDEVRLQDLYAWSGDLVGLGLRSLCERQLVTNNTETTSSEPAGTATPLAYADSTTQLLHDIVARSGNTEHAAAMARVSAQLHAIRMLEPSVLSDSHEELQTLIITSRAGSTAALRKQFTNYWRRRRRHAGELLRRRYR